MLSNRWTVEQNFDSENFMLTSKHVEGLAIFRSDVLAIEGLVPDDFRNRFGHVMKKGVMRKNIQVKIEADGLQTRYSFDDVEQVTNLNQFAGIVKAECHYGIDMNIPGPESFARRATRNLPYIGELFGEGGNILPMLTGAGQVQVYEAPIPLWPEQLRPGWQTRVTTKYKTPMNQDALLWEQTMRAHAWEMIAVPAGQFKALRFTNTINFASSDVMRADSMRQETLWFAPEVGRWVARESKGSYYSDDSEVDQPYNENGFRWELLEWS